MPKNPFEKKNSGPGSASPPPTASDFTTGNLPAPRPGMPPAGIAPPLPPSSSSSSPRFGPRPGALPAPPPHPKFKSQHLQVVDDFAVDYATTLQASDEEYRRAHALHPNESLMSIHKRKNLENLDFDLLKGEGPLILPHPQTYVDPYFSFDQSAVPGAGSGICMALSCAFIRYRCMGYGVRQIFTGLRENSMKFIPLHDAYRAFRIANGRHLNTFFSRQHRTAYPTQEYQFLEDLSLPNIGPLPQSNREKKSAAMVDKCSILAQVGHFEIDRYRPLMKSQMTVVSQHSPETPAPLRDLIWPQTSSDVHVQTASGVKSVFSIPRMDEHSQHLRESSRRNEDIEEPSIGGHLFAAMNRTLIGSSAGQPVENLPFFLVITLSEGGGHAIFVEFNTENGKITTPRGIFDPNYGWLGTRRGFNSLDFDQMLHSVFIASTITTSIVLNPRGLIQAFQLRRVAGAKPPDLAQLHR